MNRSVRCVFFLLLALALVLGGQPAQAKSSKSSSSSGGKSSSSFSSSGKSSSSSSGKSSGWSNSLTPSAPAAPAKPSSSSSSGWGNSSAPSAPGSAKPGSTPASDPGSGKAPSGWGNSAPKAAPAQSSTPKPATGGAWSNSTGTSAAPGADSGRSKSSFATTGQTAVQKEASTKAYNEYKGKFAKPDNPVRDSGAASGPQPTRTWDSYRDYSNNRDNYYAGRGWSAPGYAYRSAPSFGLWDAMFLWFMLRQASGPSFLYNHQGDPGVQAFRQEADKLAASNEDLKKQLADVDAKIAQMRKDGVPVDPKNLDGVDPSVALAAERVVREDAAKASGLGSWVWILGAGVAVAVLFLLLTRRRANTRK
ncbi:hypothetical protein GTA51_10240 [Desulfovibrio aerotolerans]|uniref:Uncharacterized protein n=1 Tax=Solidesulfovibrio aerotolerans TaxID=295255 RepID=A0A7C9IV62_9BACT|nr:hypothetical protein [Solidesulfovibrio aerotolerans]MYL83503.1 hypothetical protein [Solidesulfovibrio aerotolerans]